MVLLGLLQSGGSVLGQAMEQVTGGNLLSTLLVACAFTLSPVYLFRLAVGHMVQLPAGAVRAPQGSSVCARAKRAGSGALAVAGARGAGGAAADASAADHPDLGCWRWSFWSRGWNLNSGAVLAAPVSAGSVALN